MARGGLEGWLLAALVAIPVLIFDPFGWAVFGPVKWWAVSTLVPALAAVVALGHGLHVSRGWAIGWTLLLGWAALSASGGMDPLSAWIGTPDRRLGWWALAVFALAFVTGSSLPVARALPVVLRSATVTGLVVGAVGLLELAGLSVTGVAPGGVRVGSTLGSAAYLGAALTLLVPLAAAHAGSPSETLRWRYLAGAATAVGLAAVVGSQSRAALVGLGLAFVIVAPRWWASWRVRPLLVVALAIGAITTLALSPIGSRVFDGLGGEDPLAASRIDEWSQAIRVVAARPIVGTGPEGYRIAFPGVVDADYERAYGREVVPDRAHNGLLDVTAALGLPGGVMYLAAAVAIVTTAWRGRRGDAWKAGLAAACAGYLVQQQFLFPLAELDALFWLLTGLLVLPPPSPVSQTHPRPQAAVALALVAVLSLGAGVLEVAADRAILAGLQGDRAAADRATTLRPDSFRTWVMASGVFATGGDQASISAALARIEAALEISPDDPQLRQIRARYLDSLAAGTRDTADVNAALDAWELLAIDDPNNARVLLGLGSARALAGDVPGARSALEASAALSPGRADAHLAVARLELATGDVDAAALSLRRARSIDPVAEGLDDLERAIRARGGRP